MRNTTVMLIIALLLTLSACSPPKDSSEALHDPLSPSAYPQIAALGGLGQSLSFSSPTLRKHEDGTMTIIIPLRLIDDQSRMIEYKFEYFHGDGQPLARQEEWRSLRLQPRKPRYVESQSPSRDARDWRLVLRPVAQE